MSYEPTIWRTGDKVTAPLMNKLEQGVANSGSGGTVFVNGTVDQENMSMELDMTAGDMWQAYSDGKRLVVSYDADVGATRFDVVACSVFNGQYSFSVYSSVGVYNFSANSANSYPTFSAENDNTGTGGK